MWSNKYHLNNNQTQGGNQLFSFYKKQHKYYLRNRIGKVLALVILYEVEDINRFPKIGNFISYARLIKCAHESAGKRMTGKNSKIGNVHLKWAFSEAACLFLRANERGKNWHQKLVSKYGKACITFHHLATNWTGCIYDSKKADCF